MNTVHKGVYMPKIIKNLEPQIKAAALELYETIGYDKVSMRAIAKKVGIAVGTLYNYYPNKDILFISSLEESWNDTIIHIEKNINGLTNPKERLYILITTLYDDVKARKGLGKELLSNKPENLALVSHIFIRLQTLIIELINDYHPNAFPERKAYTLVMIIGQLITMYEEEREKNIDYLMSIV